MQKSYRLRDNEPKMTPLFREKILKILLDTKSLQVFGDTGVLGKDDSNKANSEVGKRRRKKINERDFFVISSSSSFSLLLIIVFLCAVPRRICICWM